eukprot:gb/GFBE01035337.1/.p1 GENE.gb/GFBE01035337.1/~~gb/GFBE01035337.1/.p1  ORF type:complete len:367 (+),score=71.74 gb/GFBE01035337.1/:1-1101(+)
MQPRRPRAVAAAPRRSPAQADEADSDEGEATLPVGGKVANRAGAPSSGAPTPSAASAPGRPAQAGERRGPQPLTQEVILNSTNVPRGNQSLEAFNQKLTHLQIQGKRIGPGLQRLDLVPAVYVLYAYDNCISSLSGIDHLRRLQLLYLQNNRLETMSGIEGLHMLKKLHLGGNRLSRIEGLEHCTQLEELHVPGQKTSGAPLEFDAASVSAVAQSLKVLDAAGNRLEDVSALFPLRYLSSLNLSDNNIRQVSDLRPLLAGFFLKRVQLAGNPLASQERRYRTAVVLSASEIEEIDGREVLPQERDFVKRLDEQKRKLNAQRNRHLNRVASDGAPRAAGAVATATMKNDTMGPGRTSAPPVLQDLVN